MRLLSRTILPLILFFSALVVIFNFNNNNLDDWSFKDVLIAFSQYGDNDSYNKYLSRFHNDLDAIKNYVSRNPIYDNDEDVNPSSGGVISQSDIGLNVFQKVIRNFKITFNSITNFFSEKISNSNNVFTSNLNSFTYYATGFIPFVFSTISLVYDSLAISVNFIVFFYNLLYL